MSCPSKGNSFRYPRSHPMSTRIDLATLHTRVACIQAECALWQIRRQWEHLLATTTDEGRRMQIAELLREGRCPPDRTIRGAHGYFVGCLGGDGQQNTAFHQRDVVKAYGGLKHEAEAHYQRAMMKAAGAKGDAEKTQAVAAKVTAAEDKATISAGKLTTEQHSELQDLLDRLDTETLRLGDQLQGA